MPSGWREPSAGRLATDPAEHGPDAGGQLAGPRRLGDVVGGAGLEGEHGVEFVVLGR